MKEKKIKIYARISNDDKELIIDFDEDCNALAIRWNTNTNVIRSSISHHHKTWERIEIIKEEKNESDSK